MLDERDLDDAPGVGSVGLQWFSGVPVPVSVHVPVPMLNPTLTLY